MYWVECCCPDLHWPLHIKAVCRAYSFPCSITMQGPGLKSWHWRKSSQWFGMLRSHAQLVLEDSEVFRK